MDKQKGNNDNMRRYPQANDKLAGEPLTDDHQERQLQPINPEVNTADEILYGGDENDFDREYWDNSDEHEYYDEPEKTGYHPDEA